VQHWLGISWRLLEGVSIMEDVNPDRHHYDGDHDNECNHVMLLSSSSIRAINSASRASASTSLT
jgi:hypothetical protein